MKETAICSVCKETSSTLLAGIEDVDFSYSVSSYINIMTLHITLDLMLCCRTCGKVIFRQPYSESFEYTPVTDDEFEDY